MSAIEDGAMQDKAGAQIDDLVKRLQVYASDWRNRAESKTVVDEAAAELTRLRERNAELEKALQKLSECDVPRPVAKAFRTDGKSSKNDQCPHGLFMYEECAECGADFARATLASAESVVKSEGEMDGE